MTTEAAKEKHAAQQKAWRRAHPERSRSYTAKWKARNPEKVAQVQARQDARRTPHDTRLANVRRLYGLTAPQYYALLGAQNGLCAICRMINDGRALCVDHAHVDGYEKLPHADKAALVRGLLCAGCNSIMGFCRDEPQILSAKGFALAFHAEQYLNPEHPARQAR